MRRVAAATAGSTLVSKALAHGLGERYDLPVPLRLYMLGAGAAVLLSFVVVAFFLRSGAPPRYPRLNLLRVPGVRLLASRPVLSTLRTLSVALFVLVIVTGLLGPPRPERNLAPLVVWVFWWVGVAYASALLGDVWRILNPWTTVYEWVEAALRRADPDASLSLGLPYPRWLGVWPAVAAFLAFAWVELVFLAPARPSTVVTFTLMYSGVTWAGMLLFGKHVWLRHGEAFTQVFGLLARFAPTEVRVTDASACHDEAAWGHDEAGGCVNCHACFEAAPPAQRQWNLRPFAVGLLTGRPVSTSLTVLTVLLLSTVTFDGFTATPTWSGMVGDLYAVVPDVTVIGTLGLLVFPLAFLSAYLLTCALMQATAGARVSVFPVARAFVLTLVPIALAYHLAHYLTYLLVQSQLLLPVASDPLGLGWDLFGTAGRGIDIGVVGPRFTWWTAVIAIVVGHIVAVYLAHVVAMRTFQTHRAALRSQIPMMLLMVAYTVVSLWILAQPIVEVTTPS